MELTNRTIETAKDGDTLWDTRVRGLHMRVTKRKSFYFYFRTRDKRERRPKLGDWPAMTLAKAREIALELLLEVSAGKDPVLRWNTLRDAPTVDAMCDRYVRDYIGRKKSRQQDEYRLRIIRARFGRKRALDIVYDDISAFHAALTRDSGPYEANRTLSLLSRMFNLAEKWNWREPYSNPCRHVQRNKEYKRRRYLNREEATRLAKVLDKYALLNPAPAAFIYLLLLTGARKSEIANAKWTYLDGTILRLPDSKSGKERPIYLPKAAIDILDRLPRSDDPDATLTGIQDPKAFWKKVCEEAKLTNLRLHDLRHSFASAAVAAGLSLAQIGELLGHQNAATTQRYAHLMEEVAISNVESTAEVILVLTGRAAPTPA